MTRELSSPLAQHSCAISPPMKMAANDKLRISEFILGHDSAGSILGHDDRKTCDPVSLACTHSHTHTSVNRVTLSPSSTRRD